MNSRSAAHEVDVWELQSAVDSSLTQGHLTANPNHSLSLSPSPPRPTLRLCSNKVKNRGGGGGRDSGRKVFVLIFHLTTHTADRSVDEESASNIWEAQSTKKYIWTCKNGRWDHKSWSAVHETLLLWHTLCTTNNKKSRKSKKETKAIEKKLYHILIPIRSHNVFKKLNTKVILWALLPSVKSSASEQNTVWNPPDSLALKQNNTCRFQLFYSNTWTMQVLCNCTVIVIVCVIHTPLFLIDCKQKNTPCVWSVHPSGVRGAHSQVSNNTLAAYG